MLVMNTRYSPTLNERERERERERPKTPLMPKKYEHRKSKNDKVESNLKLTINQEYKNL